LPDASLIKYSVSNIRNPKLTLHTIPRGPDIRVRYARQQ